MTDNASEVQQIIDTLSTEYNTTAINATPFENYNGNIRALLHYCDMQRAAPYVSKDCAEFEYRLIKQCIAQEEYIPLTGNEQRGLTPEQEKKYVMHYLNTEGKQFYCNERTRHGSKEQCTPFLESLNQLMIQCGISVAKQHRMLSYTEKKQMLLGNINTAKQQKTENVGFLTALGKMVALNKKKMPTTICKNASAPLQKNGSRSL